MKTDRSVDKAMLFRTANKIEADLFLYKRNLAEGLFEYGFLYLGEFFWVNPVVGVVVLLYRHYLVF